MSVQHQWPLMGVFVGDAVGCGWEHHEPHTMDFPLWTPKSSISDDSVLTIAVAQGLMQGGEDALFTERAVIKNMQQAVTDYPDAGYGGLFLQWAWQDTPMPYGSWANGGAMRVASVAWFCNTIEDVRFFATLTASPTHNHPDALLAARTLAELIFMARIGTQRDALWQHAQYCGLDLSDEATDWMVLSDPSQRACRLAHRKVGHALYSTARAVRAALESQNFEQAIRLAVMLGGDVDTQGAMAGAVAEAIYGDVSEALKNKVRLLMPQALWQSYESVRTALIARGLEVVGN